MSVVVKQNTYVPATALLGVGAYRPRRSVPNSEIIDAIDSSDEWIKTRSGISSRRIASEDETVLMMSSNAARAALERAGLQPSDIDFVMVGTVSHMYQTPALAPQVVAELGINGTAAIDISAACAGFCYGLGMASSMVQAGTVHRALVIGVERLSDITDRNDRGTAFLFADGAGAVVVGHASDDRPGIGPVVWGSDGSKHDWITQEQDWRHAIDVQRWPNLKMQGNAVFKWATSTVAALCKEALDVAGVRPEDLNAFIPHQANDRITTSILRYLKLPDSVVIARDIMTQGNTSAASIPLAMDALISDGSVSSGDLALIVGFGAGMAYAAQVVRIP